VRGLALHTWTLDTTPLAAVLDLLPRAGWDAVELRRLDFDRAREAGRSPDDVLAMVRAAGVPVACVGARHGWMFAGDGERTALLDVLRDACRWARALGCATVMSPVDAAAGDPRRAAAAVREAGDVAREHGVRLALEHQSQSPQLNRLERVREIVAAAGHPSVGVLADAYHLQRSGDLRAFEDLPAAELAYFQFSDVPADARPGFVLDRLPPGRGVTPFREVFAVLRAKGYRGWLSYEGPNEAAWARDPLEVAREAAAAARALLAS